METRAPKEVPKGYAAPNFPGQAIYDPQYLRFSGQKISDVSRETLTVTKISLGFRDRAQRAREWTLNAWQASAPHGANLLWESHHPDRYKHTYLDEVMGFWSLVRDGPFPRERTKGDGFN